MRQRSFEIIRKPDLEGTSFLFNNIRVSYVGTCPETGISFYCNDGKGGVYGVRVYPDGRKRWANSERICWVKKHGKAVYIRFRHAFGNMRGILASHAVWMAAGRIIPTGMTMDHIDGCTTDNRLENIRCIDNDNNNRDGGFLRKLRNRGFTPVRIHRTILLRYYSRMALLKPAISHRRYNNLTRAQLFQVLYDPLYDQDVFINSLKRRNYAKRHC